MTDQEQIIIDGVDVSGCGHLVDKDACGSMDCQSVECEKNPNCLFKQLTLKTQECEELKDKIKKLRKNLALEIETNDRYRKALEEIKEYTREQFCDRCEDISSTEYNCHCEYCEYQEYFDIIDKAKG